MTCSEEKEAVFAEHLLHIRQVVGGPLRSLTLSFINLGDVESTLLVSQMTGLRLDEINLKQLACFQL